MTGAATDPAAPTPPQPPRLPGRLATEIDPDIDPDFPDIDEVEVRGVGLSFPSARTLTILRSKLTECEIDDHTTASLDTVDSLLVDLDLTGRTVEALTRTTLVRCRLGGADFGEAELRDVHLDGCVLDLASMRRAQLERVVLSGCRVDGLDLTGARVTDTAFVDVPIGGISLDGARFERVDLTAAELDGVVDMSAIRGGTITETQAVALSVRLARAAGITIAPRT